MVTTTETVSAPAPRRRGPVRFVLWILFGFVLPVAVLAVGARVALEIYESRPEAKRRPPVRQARLVEVKPVRFEPHVAEIVAMGEVVPSRTLAIHARVGGEVVAVGPTLSPGSRLSAGDLVVKLDEADLEIVAAERRAEVARIESDVTLELGQQAVARRELEMLGEGISEDDRALVLRRPQLAAVQARLAAAKAAVRRAELDLSRAEVKAPFAALVRTRDVEVGTQVGVTTRLAEVVGTGEYWIEASVPVDRLRWIRVPRVPGEKGSSVRVFDEAAWGEGVHRAGEVLRLLGDLEAEGRMARVLVSVRDPLAIEPENAGRPGLLLGAYVRVEIVGRELPRVALLSRELIHDGDRVRLLGCQQPQTPGCLTSR